jgi:hypothetical protein
LLQLGHFQCGPAPIHLAEDLGGAVRPDKGSRIAVVLLDVILM